MDLSYVLRRGRTREKDICDVAPSTEPPFTGPERRAIHADLGRQVVLAEKGKRVQSDELAVETNGTAHVFQATIHGTAEQVESLLRGSPDLVHSYDASGLTPLHYAVRRPHLRMTEMLIHYGADINAASRNMYCDTPLITATEGCFIPVVDLLLRQGADKDHKNGNGFTALHIAVQRRCLALLPLLLDAGIPVDVLDDGLHSALHFAAAIGDEPMIEFLIRKGADANRTDITGKTPLHYAAREGHTMACVKLIREGGGASIKMADQEGNEPEDIAKDANLSDMLRAIGAYGIAPMRRKWPVSFQRVTRVSIFFFPWIGMPLALYLITYHSVFLYVPTFVVSYLVLRFWLPSYVEISTDEGRNMFLLGLYLVSVVVSATAYFSRVIHYTMHDITTAPFIFLFLVMMGIFFYISTADPGLVKGTHDRIQDLVSMVLDDGVPPSRLCATCWIPKEARSKHCAGCDVCVRGFDHHCAWINNCVGVNTLRAFYYFCALHILNQLLWFRLCLLYFFAAPGVESGLGFMGTLSAIYTHHTFVTLQLLWHMGHFAWLVFLFGNLTYQIALNLTTNERVNYYRYDYLKDGEGNYRNPYDRGVWSNFCAFVWGTDGGWFAKAGSGSESAVRYLDKNMAYTRVCETDEVDKAV